MVNKFIKKGLGFGITSGIITTLGLLVGLSSTSSISIVLAGIVIIAVSDALSDAMGIHISTEFESNHSSKEIWVATISTFLSKLFFALTFIFPVLFFSLFVAVIVSIVYGLLLISIFSYYLARKQNINACKVIFEHLFIAIVVIVITYFLGILFTT